MAKIELRERSTTLKETAVEQKQADPMKKFDYNYKADKLGQLYDDYDKISAEEDNDIEFETPSIVKKHVATAKARQLSFGQKLSIGVGSAIVAMLMFLAIFNIFVINGASKSIQITNEEITQAEDRFGQALERLEQAKKANDKLDDIQDQYSNETNIVLSALDKVTTVKADRVSGNWFDSLCDFFSSVFGG